MTVKYQEQYSRVTVYMSLCCCIYVIFLVEKDYRMSFLDGPAHYQLTLSEGDETKSPMVFLVAHTSLQLRED